MIKDIRPALFAFLLADAGLSALVTAGGISRIFPGRLPQGLRERSLVYNRIGGPGAYTNAGPSSLAGVRFQFDSYAQLPDDADALDRQLVQRLSGYAGVMGAGDAAVTVQGVFFQASRDGFDTEAQLNRVSRDAIIWFVER